MHHEIQLMHLLPFAFDLRPVTLRFVRIGLPDTVLFGRYGDWWSSFLTTLGVDVVRPKLPLEESLKVGAELMPSEPITMQLFAARALEMAQNVDALLIPDVNPGAEPGTRGSSTDPWLVDLPSVIGRRFSLPTIYTVPARLSPEETPLIAVRLGQALTGNAQLVRRALDRLQTELKPKTTEPIWQRANKMTVGVVGDPVLLEESTLMQPLLAAIDQTKLHPVLGTLMPRDRAIDQGKRFDDALLENDWETIGSAKLLEAKGAVRGLILVSQNFAATQQSMLRRYANKVAHKPTLQLEIGAIDPQALKNFADQLETKITAL
jgi:hypothetical protein